MFIALVGLVACGGSVPARSAAVAPQHAQPVVALPDAAAAVAEPMVAADPASEAPLVVPALRQGGTLTVVPNSPRCFENKLRIRSHVDGSLGLGDPRTWCGIEIPSFVPLAHATLELTLLDRVNAEDMPGAKADGYMAYYREPYNGRSCALSGATRDQNCATYVELYDLQGKVLAQLDLVPLYSRPTHLEIQDIRLVGGTLYFNEACQSYAREAKGKCSALVAYDVAGQAVKWRSPNLTSNARFVVVPQWQAVISGYGFTDEKDHVFVLDLATGKPTQKLAVRTAPEIITRVGDEIVVDLYNETQTRYRWVGGKLVPKK